MIKGLFIFFNLGCKRANVRKGSTPELQLHRTQSAAAGLRLGNRTENKILKIKLKFLFALKRHKPFFWYMLYLLLMIMAVIFYTEPYLKNNKNLITEKLLKLFMQQQWRRSRNGLNNYHFERRWQCTICLTNPDTSTDFNIKWNDNLKICVNINCLALYEFIESTRLIREKKDFYNRKYKCFGNE